MHELFPCLSDPLDITLVAPKFIRASFNRLRLVITERFCLHHHCPGWGRKPHTGAVKLHIPLPVASASSVKQSDQNQIEAEVWALLHRISLTAGLHSWRKTFNSNDLILSCGINQKPRNRQLLAVLLTCSRGLPGALSAVCKLPATFSSIVQCSTMLKLGPRD